MIVCNVRCLDAKITGVQRYTNSILEHFPAQTYRKTRPTPSYSHGIKGHIWEQIALPLNLKAGELLWSPSNAGPISIKRQVVTIHDLVPLDHPEWVTKTFARWYKYLLPKLCNNVNHIIAISEFTKERIIENLKIPERKITVIPNGVDPYFFEEPVHDYTPMIPFKSYVLVLGAIEPRKNLTRLLKAWEGVVDKVSDEIGLVIVGAQGTSNVFGDYVVEKNVKRVHFTGYINEKYIVSLYRNALFFAYISFYEGFGLPPLEAMATGCPVITSNVSAIPEIMQNAGLLVDPYSLTEIESAFLLLLSNPSLRKEKSLLGLERASQYSWRKTSDSTFKVLLKNL